VIASIPPVGQVEIVEIYAEYDGPVLFQVRNERDERFLVVLLADEDDCRDWLFAPVTRGRLEAVRAGIVDLHGAFATVEGGILWIVSQQGSPPSFTARWVQAASLTSRQFPRPGERLDLPLEQGSTRDPQLVARQMHRDVLVLHFHPHRPHRHEVSALQVTRVVNGVQECVIALGQSRAGRGTKVAPVPGALVRSMTLNVVATPEGSFGLELHAAEQAGMFGEGPVSAAIEALLELLEVVGDADELTRRLKRLKGSRTPSKLKSILLGLSTSVPELDVVWGRPKAGTSPRSVGVRLEDATRGIETITRLVAQEPVEFEVLGKLIGVNVNTRAFSLTDEAEGRTYAGRASLGVSLVGTSNGFEYLATIRELPEEHASGDISFRYELMRLTPAWSPAGAPEDVLELEPVPEKA